MKIKNLKVYLVYIAGESSQRMNVNRQLTVTFSSTLQESKTATEA